MIEIREESPTPATLLEYGNISIAFLVESQYRIRPIQNGLGGWLLSEEPVERPYIKDYDRDKGEGPTRWAKRWEISSWGIVAAFLDDQRIGGALVAWNTAGVNMLEGRDDLAVLWDIRVHPDYRRNGIGSLLFPHIIAWASARQCTALKIETQNINVPACKYYAHMGCQLRAFHPDAYPDFPEETQLLWYRNL